MFLKDEEAQKGLDNIDKKAEKTGSNMGKVFGNVAKGAAVIGTTAIAAGTIVFGMAKKTADQADAIDENSQKLGMSAKSYQEWGYVLAQNGGNIESMGVGLKTMTNLLDDAKNGGQASIDAFNQLGITMEDMQSMSREEIFEKTIQGLQGMEDETAKAAIANQLLGRAGMDLMPTLNMTAEEIQAQKDRAHELGLVLSDEAVKGGGAFADQMVELQATLGGLANQALAPLMPMLAELMKGFTEALPGLMKFIAPLIQKLMPVISTIISKLLPVFIRLLEALTPILDPVIDIFLMLVDEVLLPLIDLLIPIIEELMPIFVDLFKQLMPVLKPLIQIFMQLLQSALPPLVEILAEMAKALMPMIEMILPIFVDLLNMLMPIIDPLIQLILMLVDIALKPMMGYFDFFTKNILPAFIQIFEGLKPIIEGVMIFIQAIISGIMAVINADWSAIWQGIKDFFAGIGEGLKNIIQSVADFFSGIWTSIKNFAIDAWNGLVDGVKGIANGFLDFVKGIPDKVIGFFSELPAKLLEIGKNLVTGLWEGIKSMANFISEKVSGFFNGIVDGIKGILGISSPSLVLKGVGINVDRGFVGGIDEEMDTAEEAGARLAKAAQVGVEQVQVGVAEGSVNVTGQSRTESPKVIEHHLTGTLDVVTTQDENFARKVYRFVIDELKNEYMLQGAR